MPDTFVKIATVTVGAGGAASIEFTSIPSTYTDLQVLVSTRASNASIINNQRWTFNSSSTGYSYKELYGDGSNAASGGSASASYADLAFQLAHHYQQPISKNNCCRSCLYNDRENKNKTASQRDSVLQSLRCVLHG